MSTKLLTIYGARMSKDGKYLNLTLIEGSDDKKEFYTACVKPERFKIKGEDVYIKVKKLKEFKHIDEKPMTDEELPF